MSTPPPHPRGMAWRGPWRPPSGSVSASHCSPWHCPSHYPGALAPSTPCTPSVLSWGAGGHGEETGLHPCPLTLSLTTLAAFPTSALQGEGLSGQTSKFMRPRSRQPQLCAPDRSGFGSISPGSLAGLFSGETRWRTPRPASQHGRSLGVTEQPEPGSLSWGGRDVRGDVGDKLSP